ncbi:hypothetical protein [Glaesserella sp.]|uniref:hypothetical protein n=1 Tax=Glaesserella sp. TaxID=2094731 RepID=UPI0035A12B82
MKRSTQFGLTLLSAIILSACNHGDSSKPVNSALSNQSTQSGQSEADSEKNSSQQTEEAKTEKAKTEEGTTKENQQSSDIASNTTEEEIKKPDEVRNGSEIDTDDASGELYPVEFPQKEVTQDTLLTQHKAVFERLKREWDIPGYDGAKTVVILDENQNIKLMGSEALSSGQHLVEKLVDKDGYMFGYYGYDFGRASHGDPTYIQLLAIDDSAPRSSPVEDMTYKGKMNYFYQGDISAEPMDAEIIGDYQVDSKTLNLDILGPNENEVWQLKPTPVNSNGTLVTPYLYQGDDKVGEFTGAMYGKNGEVIVGETRFKNLNREEGLNDAIGILKADAVEK